jgi:hypothetical protein
VPQLNDELAARAMLADLTAGQPPAPPDRYGTVRRRAVLHRRRQLAAIAAAVAVLAVAAVTIPLGLRAIAPPMAPGSNHLSEVPPPGDRGSLVATVTMNGKPWRVLLSHWSGHPRGAGPGLCADIRPGSGLICQGGPVAAASGNGDPADVSFGISLGAQWQAPELNIATVRSDVTSLRIGYTNGQVLTLHPVQVFAGPYARYVVIASPRLGSVETVTAFAGHRDLGYAIPFGGEPEVNLPHWLRPGQPAPPRPVTRVIGSGTVEGTSWTETVTVGPSGTCLYGSGGDSVCAPVTGSELSRGQLISPIGGVSVQDISVRIYPGEAAPSVSYLVLTLQDHSAVRVPVVALRGRRFFACADAQGNRIVRWAAYDAAGHLLVTSKPGQVP